MYLMAVLKENVLFIPIKFSEITDLQAKLLFNSSTFINSKKVFFNSIYRRTLQCLEQRKFKIKITHWN